MDALTRLRATFTVANYKAQVDGLSNLFKGLREAQIELFLKWLKR